MFSPKKQATRFGEPRRHPMNNFFLSSFTLYQREVWRFLRQKNRIIGALGTPLVFWLLIGSGLNQSFNVGMNYLQYFFPGTIVLVIFFTTIFSTIAVIEDRREGFLQGVLVAPIPRSAVVFGNLLGGTTLATLQGLLFACLSPLLGISFGFGDFFFILMVMVLMAFGLTGLGFILAWRMDSTQGFHAIMNLFLMPLWLLSGALFPLDGAPQWLRLVMRLNPLTYGVSALHHGFYHDAASLQTHLPSAGASLGITFVFALLMFAGAIKTATKNSY